MVEKILNLFMKKGFLVDKETLDLFKKVENVDFIKFILEKLRQKSKERIINKSFLINNYNLIREVSISDSPEGQKTIEKFFIDLGISLEITKEKTTIIEKDVQEKGKNEEDLRFLKLSENIVKKIAVEDFVKHFKNRYNFLKKVLQERPELQNLVSLDKITSNKQFSVIALVSAKRVTKNKNFLFEIEDLTGRTVAIVNKNRPEIYEKAKDVLLDEVVGLKCSGSREMVFVNDILFPEAMLFEKKKSKADESVAFTSDLHVGSDKFLEKNFLKFISWINGDLGSEEQKKEALKIKYLFITGDSIDGVGIYPGQEFQLDIKDIQKQYEKLTEYLSKIRQDLKIIICPGQHDSVRVAEPQPIIDKQFGGPLYGLKNLFLVTNPCTIEIGKDAKFKILMYHGASMHGVINDIDKLRFGKGNDSPAEVVKYLLKKRHLAPTHSSVVYIPNEKEDPLLIKEIPDIIATGDLHRSEIAQYNNILIIASSCWQSITPFEEKVGNNPDPCKVPVFNLKTRKIKILDFS